MTRPAMSVVLATPDDYPTIRATMSHLRRQTARASLEIIVVAPGRLELEDMEVFARYEVVEMGPIVSIGQANAAGIRRATADVVALAEDHCFPRADWAENLIRSHAGPWAAVGPAVCNANPRGAVSWADLFIGYGPWLYPTAAREADFLPGHNSSYKRDVLLQYGDRLESMMEAETLLHWDMRKQGHHLYVEPAARVAHTNFSLWSSWLPVQFHNGRLFASMRVRNWSGPWRLAYLAGSPLIPWIRLARIAAQARASSLHRQLWTCLPALLLGLLVDAAGQMVGCALGAGDAVREVARFEFHRSRHVTEQDRREVFGP